MARRPKTSPLEDYVDLVALLPWWACIGAALLSYLILHAMAKPVALSGIQASQMAPVMTHAMLQGLAMLGQYLVPILCLVAAAVSVAQRQQRRSLVDGTQGRAPDALDGMSWQQFELLVGEAFRLQGYEVAEVGGEGPDGGIDLVLRKDGEKLLVQCKQWKAFKVGVSVVRELYGVMAASGATGGFVVTSGMFTEEATLFASGRNVTLIDGPKLFGLIQQARAARGDWARADTQVRPMEPWRAAEPTAPAPLTTGPVELGMVCLVCSSTMVRRRAKRGANAGKEFWGCTGYPSCRGTRPIEVPTPELTSGQRRSAESSSEAQTTLQ